jgi:hypothetical protein
VFLVVEETQRLVIAQREGDFGRHIPRCKQSTGVGFAGIGGRCLTLPSAVVKRLPTPRRRGCVSICASTFAFEWNGLSSAAIEVGADAGEPWLAAVGGAAAAIK